MAKLQTEAVLKIVREQRDPGVPFTARDLSGLPKEKLHSVQNALWMLHKKGFLDKPRGRGTRGVYILRNRKASVPLNGDSVKKKMAKRVTPVQAIYDLLDFMAKAEPVLKRAAKILEAVDNA